MDTLAVLAHLARQRLDQHRRALHGIDQALATTRDQLRILGQDIEEERRAACALTDGELLLVRYQRRVLERERALHIELGRLERERAAEASRIAEHHLEVRRLEILAERRAARMRSACCRREQKTLDELALARRHCRRQLPPV